MLNYVTFEIKSYFKMLTIIGSMMYKQARGESDTRERFFDF